MAVLALASHAVAAATPADATPTLRVRYPSQESRLDARRAYPIAVLKLALERSGVRHRLEPSQLNAPQTRTLGLVEQGDIDVVWSVPTRERSQRLRMVARPIDRGLIGWRLLLVRREDAAALASLRDPRALATRLGVQGHDWPDLPILRANGLQVAAGASYESAFEMLARGRVDYFPRAASEIEDEVAARPAAGFAVASGLALHYPSALVFFVRRDNVALADALTRGLDAAQRDGSLQALFQRMQGPTLARLRLDRRHVIELRNADLPPALAGSPAAWWYRPTGRPR